MTRLTWMLLVMAGFAFPPCAGAHSASDAYLSITADKPSHGRIVVHGQWDIALRDLDFVLHLDDDGDGRLTWREVRHHQAAIAHYAFQYLELGTGNACSITPGRQMIDDHADGAYATLFFDATCTGAPQKLNVRYDLFFTIDPSHRGIFVMHSGENIATALLSPENAKIDVAF